MLSSTNLRTAWFAFALCSATLSPAVLRAASFPEFVDPNPVVGNGFGTVVVPLSTGNVVITSPGDDGSALNGGAVYLFNGSTGALISAVRGTHANDQIGSSGVTALSNGNYVIRSPSWDNGAAADAGALTWGSGVSGVNGVVTAANSLVGSTSGDNVGSAAVTVLPNGSYVVRSPNWDNGATANAGAVTWGSGTGVTGAVSAANSLVGSTANDNVGSLVAMLTNGNYVVVSPNWDNGGIVDAGAATWGNGATGASGAVAAANSLVGSTAGDAVGGSGLAALSNGNYVVTSPQWDNGGIVNAGAATWANGTTGLSGPVSAANSLVGLAGNDNVGSASAVALTNGHYVVRSPSWDNGAIANVGAATWGNGTTGVMGAVTSANSLVGATDGDQVGITGLTALSNGNYVVTSATWDNGAATDAGAATWGNGATGLTGTVSIANSLVGSTAGDNIGNGGVTALTNGHYVVRSPNWRNGAVSNAGAVTWGSGTAGVAGAVAPANSLVGSSANDVVGNVMPLTNGNYVVTSPSWDNGGIADAGGATWGNGSVGITGVISGANSLVGSTAGDLIGGGGGVALANGNYVVASPLWNNTASGVVDAGAATWGNGSSGVTGTVSSANSLVGLTAADNVGSGGVTALANGNYVVRSTAWRNGGIFQAGAATWGNGTTGVTGAVSAANSLVGSTSDDQIGSLGVQALSNGNYVVTSPFWNNGAIANAGAATGGDGATGVTGVVGLANSLLGSVAAADVVPAIEDAVNGTFISVFRFEGGGRARVGPPANAPTIVSAVDIPNDQGGWLRLTFLRSFLDVAGITPTVSMYGVWRHVPGTVIARASEAIPGGENTAAVSIEQWSGLLPRSLDVWKAGNRVFVTATPMGSAEAADAFPPGTWELVTSVPAVQQVQYVVATPTISNAVANDFVVTAHTTTPSVWFMSNTINGQSVDNLAPAQPTAFIAAYSSGQTNLQWAANAEPDLGSYSLYRGSSADFTPSPGNRIASPIATQYADVGPAGSYYKLSALDVNGNESGFALITPNQTTAVEDEPVAFDLAGVRPNPARRHDLRVAFALPHGAPARLELVDVSGRRVVARDVGTMGTGRHTVNLAEGRGVAAGIYWVRLTQGANRLTTRAAVVE